MRELLFLGIKFDAGYSLEIYCIRKNQEIKKLSHIHK